MQSAYKPFHSTETALLKVKNDILMEIDKKSGVCMALIDLSAAFDTVDHNILLSFLQDTIGITGDALNWFQSYLTGRTQCVSIDNVMSELVELMFGVPQGSVMGPFKFCIYTLPIGAIIRAHGLKYHIYADDTQVYLALDINNPQAALNKLNSCLKDIRSWMIKNKLKINDSKTEFIILASPHSHKEYISSGLNLTVGNSVIKPSQAVRNLGVMLDNTLKMDSHVTSVCKSANFHLRNIGSIRSSLTDSAAAQLVHSFITSRLDYCNSLLVGLSDNQIQKLQRIQNNAARMVRKIGKFEHISPVLAELHWLPVAKRIDFKLLLIVFKCLNNMAPTYLSDLLVPYAHGRETRSTDNQNLLQVPRTKLKTYGDVAFEVAGPRAWNKLPSDLRLPMSLDSFKKKLKTFLFTS